jgi:hypothetical protein
VCCVCLRLLFTGCCVLDFRFSEGCVHRVRRRREEGLCKKGGGALQRLLLLVDFYTEPRAKSRFALPPATADDVLPAGVGAELGVGVEHFNAVLVSYAIRELIACLYSVDLSRVCAVWTYRVSVHPADREPPHSPLSPQPTQSTACSVHSPLSPPFESLEFFAWCFCAMYDIVHRLCLHWD